jgi:hypothetical protein
MVDLMLDGTTTGLPCVRWQSSDRMLGRKDLLNLCAWLEGADLGFEQQDPDQYKDSAWISTVTDARSSRMAEGLAEIGEMVLFGIWRPQQTRPRLM